MQISLAFVVLIAAYYVPRVLCGDQCFDINQVQVGIDGTGADYMPCQPSALTSNCCPLGWICLSRGLCEPIPGNTAQNHGLTALYTGLCTDPLWENGTVCPKICNNNLTFAASPESGNGIVPCGGGYFCCYGQHNPWCCNTSSSVFFLGVATDVTTLTSPRSVTTTQTTETPTATTSLLSTRRSSSSSAVFIAPTTSSTIPASINASATAVTSTPVATSTPKAGLDQHAAVGVGVGVAVGSMALIGFIYFMRRRSKSPPESPLHSEGPLYVDGKKEMDAVQSQKENTREHKLVNESRCAELPGENVPVELTGPRAEMV